MLETEFKQHVAEDTVKPARPVEPEAPVTSKKGNLAFLGLLALTGLGLGVLAAQEAPPPKRISETIDWKGSLFQGEPSISWHEQIGEYNRDSGHMRKVRVDGVGPMWEIAFPNGTSHVITTQAEIKERLKGRIHMWTTRGWQEARDASDLDALVDFWFSLFLEVPDWEVHKLPQC